MVEGYILLPKGSSNGYYGVDRGLFEPALIESEFEPNIPGKKYDTVSSFYPAGWRKTAYDLYESNQVNIDEIFGTLKDYDTAIKIRELISPHLGEYDIFFTQIGDLSTKFSKIEPFYGYDFAYPGGDFYSAINNGLICNGSVRLISKYHPYLNEHGLFNDPSLFGNYIDDFKKEVQSEINSTFSIYLLIKK